MYNDMRYLLILVVGLVAGVVAVLTNEVPISDTEDAQEFDHSRIHDGDVAALGQFPWQVGVYRAAPGGGSFFCGGSLISTTWVLTAAHCVVGSTRYSIHLGHLNSAANVSDGGVRIRSSHSVAHPDYDSSFLQNDIALIRLPEEVALNDRIQVIPLPNRTEYLGADVTVTVSGWGRTSNGAPPSRILRFVNLETITNTQCELTYPNSITNSSLCAQGARLQDICEGDSGGPLVAVNPENITYQVGVTSHGHPGGCGLLRPAVFIRPEQYLDWISEHTDLDL